jgi:hypothetical protein
MLPTPTEDGAHMDVMVTLETEPLVVIWGKDGQLLLAVE